MIGQESMQALQTAAIAARDASTMPQLPIKAAGRTFVPPDDDKYLELIRIPNNITGEFWGDEKTYRGLFRIILHWKLDDQGAYPAIVTLQSIVSFFTKSKSFAAGNVSVKILDEPDYLGEIEASPSNMYPVSIRYQCFKP